MSEREVESVTVASSARLHFGFYNFLSDNVAWGGAGIAIDNPKVIVRVYKSYEFKVENKTNIDVSDVVNKVVEGLGIRDVIIEIVDVYTRHVGLGLTTQLALSLGYAISLLYDLGLDVRQVAYRVGRGRFSGIGVASFELGGFIIDSGRVVSQNGFVPPPSTVDDIPYAIYRQRVPRGWIFNIFIVKNAKNCGLGEYSEKVLEDPRQIPKDVQIELYKTVLHYILPAIAKKDFNVFAAGLQKFQKLVVDAFEKFFDVSINCEETDHVINLLSKYGLKSVGKSVWGPMVYGLYEYSYRKCVKISNIVAEELKERGYSIEKYVTHPKITGASITVVRSRKTKTWKIIA
ncbi:hypothetical protein QPL79_07530 [Ignisphaera sp. 4213-co]|uniref:Beta-ribofuranosylaminobenzene 5'-phosphate synthase n=1 Tax=Ignisphaera cupida TaxID=3050454 RepID=A0ABD4Z784_9CREN|nr:beta-ribofuranosylaminobenzene 5'-phosphate synthase family protein [Ignisphaera sp. 4213-co]MDK6029212.1 hypothetical protein [Ignisphaera sp. 4213-co]